MSVVDRSDRLALLKSLYAERKPKAVSGPRKSGYQLKKRKSRRAVPIAEVVALWSGDRTKSGLPKSKYRGVSWGVTSGRWVARLHLKNVERSLGRFDDELAAAQAYDASLIRYGVIDSRHRPNFLEPQP